MKLFDRQKKQEINLYAYYDHAGIVRHLEDMARQGWQLEKAGSVFWTYRRGEPAARDARPDPNYGNAPFVRIDEKRIVDNATIEKVIDILREEYFAGGAE